jgi:hypothetical protein
MIIELGSASTPAGTATGIIAPIPYSRSVGRNPFEIKSVIELGTSRRIGCRAGNQGWRGAIPS